MSRYAIEDYTQVGHVMTKVGGAADEGGAGPREGTPVVGGRANVSLDPNASHY